MNYSKSENNCTQRFYERNKIMPNFVFPFLSLSASNVLYIVPILFSAIVITVVTVIILKSKKKTPPVRKPQIGFRGEEDGFVRVDTDTSEHPTAPPAKYLGFIPAPQRDTPIPPPTAGIPASPDSRIGASFLKIPSKDFLAGLPARNDLDDVDNSDL